MRWPFKKKHVHEWPDRLAIALLSDHAAKTGRVLVIHCKTCPETQVVSQGHHGQRSR